MYSPEAFGSQGLGFGSPTQATQGRKPREEQKSTCLPVTIREIETAINQRDEGDGEMRFFGTEQSMLIVVGAIETLVKQPASMEFTLNDSTGRIKARHYMTGEMSKDLEGLEAGCYVSVFGNVRTAPVVHFAVTGMRKVQSADEVSYHMIESAHAALRLQTTKKDPATPKKVGLEAGGGLPMEVTPTKMDNVFAAVSPGLGESPPAAAPAPPAEPKAKLEGAALRSAALEFIKKEGEGNEEGVAVHAVRAALNPATLEEVRTVLQELVDSGDAFTAIDDDHFSAL